jgi:hypothetical protein
MERFVNSGKARLAEASDTQMANDGHVISRLRWWRYRRPKASGRWFFLAVMSESHASFER